VTAATEVPPPMVAGASDAELALMREAAARVAGAVHDAGVPDLFGSLASPFCPAPPGARANYSRTGGRLWCTAPRERP
jgi:hypothetical protein